MGAQADRTKSRIKEGVGGLTDNKQLKDKGSAEPATGTAKEGRPRYRQGQEGARLDMQRVRVEVVDPGSHFTRVRPRSSRDDVGGWGRVLVDRIAACWEVGGGAHGICVRFEVEFEG
jgi:uncharacterized protein YjbJ (UPF0337 family)